jgi:hypothetical protein
VDGLLAHPLRVRGGISWLRDDVHLNTQVRQARDDFVNVAAYATAVLRQRSGVDKDAQHADPPRTARRPRWAGLNLPVRVARPDLTDLGQPSA